LQLLQLVACGWQEISVKRLSASGITESLPPLEQMKKLVPIAHKLQSQLSELARGWVFQFLVGPDFLQLGLLDQLQN
jgi:hypothetical protein